MRGGTHSPAGEGGGGQYFGRRQTLDWPLTVYSLYDLWAAETAGPIYVSGEERDSHPGHQSSGQLSGGGGRGEGVIDWLVGEGNQRYAQRHRGR